MELELKGIEELQEVLEFCKEEEEGEEYDEGGAVMYSRLLLFRTEDDDIMM
jgi:hypothetical protein